MKHLKTLFCLFLSLCFLCGCQQAQNRVSTSSEEIAASTGSYAESVGIADSSANEADSSSIFSPSQVESSVTVDSTESETSTDGSKPSLWENRGVELMKIQEQPDKVYGDYSAFSAAETAWLKECVTLEQTLPTIAYEENWDDIQTARALIDYKKFIGFVDLNNDGQPEILANFSSYFFWRRTESHVFEITEAGSLIPILENGQPMKIYMSTGTYVSEQNYTDDTMEDGKEFTGMPNTVLRFHDIGEVYFLRGRYDYYDYDKICYSDGAYLTVESLIDMGGERIKENYETISITKMFPFDDKNLEVVPIIFREVQSGHEDYQICEYYKEYLQAVKYYSTVDYHPIQYHEPLDWEVVISEGL